MQIIREIAYEFLLKNDIKEPLTKIERLETIVRNEGWKIYPYSRAADLLESLHLTHYTYQYKGFTYINQDIVIIFYDDKAPYKDKIFIICHEIGHLYLRHTFSGTVTISGDADDEQEQEANTFAREALLPLCVLQRCRKLTIREIADKNISTEPIAKAQFASLAEHRLHLSDNAQKVRKSWMPYIGKATGIKKRKCLITTVVSGIVAAAIACGATIGSIFSAQSDPSGLVFTTNSTATSALAETTKATQAPVMITLPDIQPTTEATTQATTAKPTPAPTLPPTTTRYIPPAPTTAPRPKPPTEWITPVYCTESGKKYHATPNCSALKSAKTPVYRYDYFEAAINGGRTPCSICYDLLS